MATYWSSRSLLSQCSQIWRPTGPADAPFENFQKRINKWALKESLVCYRETEYLEKLYIQPILAKYMVVALRAKEFKNSTPEMIFSENNRTIFHKLIHNLIPLPLPKELNIMTHEHGQIKIKIEPFS